MNQFYCRSILRNRVKRGQALKWHCLSCGGLFHWFTSKNKAVLFSEVGLFGGMVCYQLMSGRKILWATLLRLRLRYEVRLQKLRKVPALCVSFLAKVIHFV